MTPSRATDDATLRMVQLRHNGMSPLDIAALYGVSVQYVSTATNRVFRADLAESGEDVTGAYWRVKRAQ